MALRYDTRMASAIRDDSAPVSRIAAVVDVDLDRRVLSLVTHGWTVSSVARQLGMADADVRSRLARALADRRHAAAVERDLDLARIDEALESIGDAVRAGDLGACRVLVLLLDRRARYLALDALDAAIDGATAEEQALAQRVIARIRAVRAGGGG